MMGGWIHLAFHFHLHEMPQKRSHNKSRRGCLVCRKRRVKCDEVLTINFSHTLMLTPPARTVIVEVTSVYGQSKKQVTTAPYPSPPLSPTHKSLAAHTPPPYSAVFADITNTMLMHHYTTVTCLYGISNKEIIALRQIQTPKLAFRYPFMLSVLISHAALDLSLRHDPVHNPPEHDYLAISRAHMRTAWDKNLAPQTVATVGDSMAFVVRFVMSSLHGLLAPGVLLPGWKPKLLAWIPHCRRMFQDLMASIPALQAKVPLSNVLHAMRIPLSETTIPPHVTLHPSIMSIHLPWGGAPDPEELQDENVASLYLEAVSKLQVAYAISTRNGH
ncbi:hypothetical protein DL96DRAFT_1552734 [Flagelloscypha sp. PMI_526]|nr:hypothetical protein DL96DRAFT_1552734 [Flagelloscypha sp. PMI_526]